MHPLFSGPALFLEADMDYEKKIKKAESISEIFEIAKEIVWEYLGVEQAGLMVGISDLEADRLWNYLNKELSEIRKILVY